MTRELAKSTESKSSSSEEKDLISKLKDLPEFSISQTSKSNEVKITNLSRKLITTEGKIVWFKLIEKIVEFAFGQKSIA